MKDIKLIVDIPEDSFQRIKEYYENNDVVEAIYSDIYHGTPLEQEPKIDWIPVTERLPENHKNVLVSIHNYEGRQFVYIGYFASLSNTWIIEGVEYNVDAWMPLPEPYKESEG